MIALLLSGAACQDGEISQSQVCQFQCDYTDANARLEVADVVQIIANALFEARVNGIDDLTVVVNDHLNNVLAVYDSQANTVDFSLITSLGDTTSETERPFSVPPGGNANFAVPANGALNTALDGVFIPAGYAAISKAGTANYFSTQGNAFSSRTASTLIQQNFFPGETDRPGGPLFAVQIAQLVCSDVNTRQGITPGTNTAPASTVTGAPNPADLLGPRRLPVGFAADPGGLPLYKDGVPDLTSAVVPTPTGKVVVGAVGVEFNGIYSLDKNALDADRNLEERIAFAATRGFEADPERRANRITVAGRALRFADDAGVRSNAAAVPQVTPADLVGDAAIRAFLDGISGQAGDFVNDQFFFPFDVPRTGVNFLTNASGVIAAPLNVAAAPRGTTAQGEIVVLADGTNRFPAIDGLNPAPVAGDQTGDGLSTTEVQELLVNALLLAEDTRAQTRTPLGGQARIDVAVVDLDGNILGFARSQDALLDGIDVTIAKTRQAAFWSKANARTQLENAFDPLGNNGLLNTIQFDTYVDQTAGFLGLPAPAVAIDPPFNGAIAWSSIALGGIANPDFPPGVASGNNGPLSRNPDISEWSIFSTGIQTEIVLPAIALGLCEEVPDLAGVLSDLRDVEPALAGVAPPPGGRAQLFSLAAADVAQRVTFCQNIRTALLGTPDPASQLDCMQGVQDFPAGSGNITGLQNGFHIFQGAVPIYRRNANGTSTLIGAYGVSGDGAEQDDFVPFVSLDEVFNAQRARGINNPIGNAPGDIRADNVQVSGVNLRYVVCPVAPFLSSNEQNGCSGR